MKTKVAVNQHTEIESDSLSFSALIAWRRSEPEWRATEADFNSVFSVETCYAFRIIINQNWEKQNEILNILGLIIAKSGAKE